MGDIGDVDLNRPSLGPEAPPPAHRPAWLLIAAALLLALAFAVWYWRHNPAPADSAALPSTGQGSGSQRAPGRLAAEPGEAIDLPPLDESDALVRELVSRLSAHPHAAAWLATDHLIRNFVAVVANIAGGETPAPHLKAVAPERRFQAQQQGTAIYIDPRSYARYDTHASAVSALDARGAARLFATLKPRMEEAYQDLGAPDGSLDRTLEKAIVELLRTPVVDAGVRLESTSVAYSFADPELESLSHAQRQFLRMGPRNVRLVQDKLREIAGHLGIPEASLPRQRVIGSGRR